MVGQGLRCEQVWKEISNYVDDDVEAALRQKMDEHLHACPRCASVLAGTRNVVALFGDERMLELPAGFSQRLAARIELKLEQAAAKQPAWSPRRASPWSTWSAWLAPIAALALFAASLSLVDRFTSTSPAKSAMAELARDIPPDLPVVVSNGSKIFHEAGCEFIHDKATERTITAQQAIHDGYVPCTRCMRQYLSSSSLTEHAVVENDRAEALEQQLEQQQEQQEESPGRARR